MTITLRGTKGSALTHAELDANFTTLQAADTAATAALAAHEADTSTHGVGVVVGTTETQILTNKTLTSPTLTSPTISSGNMAFSGTAQRITLDTSNGTFSDRTIFQDRAANTSTLLHAMPNGTGTQSGYLAFGGSDPDNASFGLLSNQAGSATLIRSSKTGTGTALPIIFDISNTSIVNIATDGTVTFLVKTFGYGAGAGGTVTQLTSKSTAVTLNKPSGQITTAADSLAAGASVNFILNNSTMASTDILVVNGKNPNYEVRTLSMGTQQAQIRITNITGSSLAEAITINFITIKGSTT